MSPRSEEPTLYERVVTDASKNVAPNRPTVIRTRRPGKQVWWALLPEGRAVPSITHEGALTVAHFGARFAVPADVR